MPAKVGESEEPIVLPKDEHRYLIFALNCTIIIRLYRPAQCHGRHYQDLPFHVIAKPVPRHRPRHLSLSKPLVIISYSFAGGFDEHGTVQSVYYHPNKKPIRCLPPLFGITSNRLILSPRIPNRSGEQSAGIPTVLAVLRWTKFEQLGAPPEISNTYSGSQMRRYSPGNSIFRRRRRYRKRKCGENLCILWKEKGTPYAYIVFFD